MTLPIGKGAPAGVDEATRLRHVARELEGVFVQEMFTAMLDGEIATRAPERWERGLAEALYRQLAGPAGVEAKTNGESNQGEAE